MGMLFLLLLLPLLLRLALLTHLLAHDCCECMCAWAGRDSAWWQVVPVLGLLLLL